MEEYIIALYQLISKKQELTDIEEYLPSTSDLNFTEVMEGVIKNLEKEKNELSLIDDIDAIYLCEELDKKISICKNLLKKEKEELLSTNGNIILASSHSGNNLIESDISSIEKEKYPVILKVLKEMLSGNKTNNQVTHRKFTNNKDLKDCFEFKGWQIRIVYQKIDKDSLYVNLIKTKKSDNDKKDLSEIISRIKYTTLELEKFRKIFKDPLQKEKIVKENEKKLEEIIIKLEDKKEKNIYLENKKQLTSNQKHTKEKLEDLDDCWISMYKLAKTIYENKGTIKMKYVYKVNNIEIGKWIFQQKKLKTEGLLSETKIKLLEDLEIEWNEEKEEKKSKTQQEKWMENYSVAKNFYLEHGHLKVSFRNQKLASWLYQQKNKYKIGKLKTEQITMLEAIGIDWNVRKINRVNCVSSKNNIIRLDNLDSLSDEKIYEIKDKIDKKVNEIESQKFKSIITLYEKMYEQFNGNPDLLSEFVLRLENDHEGLASVAMKLKK